MLRLLLIALMAAPGFAAAEDVRGLACWRADRAEVEDMVISLPDGGFYKFSFGEAVKDAAEILKVDEDATGKTRSLRLVTLADGDRLICDVRIK